MAEKEEKPVDPRTYFKDWDEVEVTKDQLVKYTGTYPKPANRFRIIIESPNAGIEAMYFWSLSQFRGIGYPTVDKLTDLFSASEASSMFGAGQQRLGLSQDRVMQFLRVIHDMVRSIPVYVRELRAIAERLDYYEKSQKKDPNSDGSEITLKGLYVDLVEGGSKSPASVFGLAQQVGFVILPDLFFRMRRNVGEDEIDFWKRVDSLEKDFNPNVVTTLKRKLTQYYTWKKHSELELKRRRSYLLKYLRQYYSTIKLYMNWVKPYLRVVKNLQLDLDKNTRAELVKAFETSMVEVEVLGRKAEEKSKSKDPKTGKTTMTYNCILLTFNYRTKPSMAVTTPDYQHRGPVHVGEAEITWRSYAWSDKDIEAYRKIREQEEFDLLKGINETLRASLEGVEDDLKKFLDEADKEASPPKKEEQKPKGLPAFESFMEPITAPIKGAHEAIGAVWGGFKDVAKAFWPETKKGGGSPAKKDIEKSAKKMTYLFYKNFKKAHGMVAW